MQRSDALDWLDGHVRETPVGKAPARTTGHLLEPGWAWCAGLVGPAVAVAITALEPVPSNPEAASVFATVMGLALFATFIGAGIAAARRRPSALGWAGLGVLVSLAMVIACPTTGHHTSVGAWWYGELVVCVAALGVVMRGLASRRTHS